MHLPNADLAVVEREKIIEYLLNPEHPDNGGKAAFFASLGFSHANSHGFANALRKLALTAEVDESMELCTARSILLTENWKIQHSKRLGFVRFGLSMPERIFRGW